ncbi:MAG: hypothetical protein U0P30_13125 [Vicinamibacterales bacterium]
MERVRARVADPASPRPDDAETARFCEADEAVGERCGRLPSGHPATQALREAGHALTSAVELHYVARGWHDDLGLAPGDPRASRRPIATGHSTPPIRWRWPRPWPRIARRERQTAEERIAQARTRV